MYKSIISFVDGERSNCVAEAFSDGRHECVVGVVLVLITLSSPNVGGALRRGDSCPDQDPSGTYRGTECPSHIE